MLEDDDDEDDALCSGSSVSEIEVLNERDPSELENVRA